MNPKIRNITLGAIGGVALIVLFFRAFIWSENPVEYLNRVETSIGTDVQSKTFDDLKLNLKYKSPAYQAAAQLVKSSNIDNYNYQELIKEFSQFSNYQLRLENIAGGALLKEMASSSGNYQKLVQYLSFGIQKDLILCTPTDTLNCAFVHFERNYDLAPFTNIEIGFDIYKLNPPLLKEKEWVVQFDAERFGLGPLLFRYQSKEVDETPMLFFEKQ